MTYSISSAAALASASASTTDNYSSAYWCFDAYRRGDVYSYALVMWEVLSRTIITPNNYPSQPPQQQVATNNEYNPYVYRAPYQDRGVGWDPGFDDMRNIVCSADPVMSRPGVASEWLDNPVGFYLLIKLLLSINSFLLGQHFNKEIVVKITIHRNYLKFPSVLSIVPN